MNFTRRLPATPAQRSAPSGRSEVQDGLAPEATESARPAIAPDTSIRVMLLHSQGGLLRNREETQVAIEALRAAAVIFIMVIAATGGLIAGLIVVVSRSTQIQLSDVHEFCSAIFGLDAWLGRGVDSAAAGGSVYGLVLRIRRRQRRSTASGVRLQKITAERPPEKPPSGL